MKSKLLSSLSLLAGISLVLGSCLNDDSITPYQQLQEDIAEIDKYLLANPPDPSHVIVRDARTGLRMVITERPEANVDGAEPVEVQPTLENIIEVGYVGRRLSKGQLTDPFEINDSYTFTLTNEDAGGSDVIEGWKHALGMMYKGMKARVFIPSGIAYGTSGQGPIPDNAILVFDLDLKEVNTSDQEPRFTEDKSAISGQLEGDLDVVVHPNGFSYKLESSGTGPRPDLYDQVSIIYTGKLLNGTVFADNITQDPVNIFSSRPVNYIHGLALGLQLMHEGDKATFYIPSALGYGPAEQSVIPANSNLIFEVELVKVTTNPQ